MAGEIKQLGDILLKWVDENGSTLFRSPTIEFNKRQVSTDDWPNMVTVRSTLMDKLGPYIGLVKQNKPISDRVYPEIVTIFADGLASAAGAVARAQENAVQNGRINLPFMTDYFDEGTVDLLGTLKSAAANDTSMAAADRTRIINAVQQFIRNYKREDVNIKAAVELAKKRGEVVTTPAASSVAGAGGKIAIAAAVLVGGFILWKFFTRNR